MSSALIRAQLLRAAASGLGISINALLALPASARERRLDIHRRARSRRAKERTPITAGLDIQRGRVVVLITRRDLVDLNEYNDSERAAAKIAALLLKSLDPRRRGG